MDAGLNSGTSTGEKMKVNAEYISSLLSTIKREQYQDLDSVDKMTDAMLAESVLHLIPDGLVAWSIRKVFGLGNKCSWKQERQLQRFRYSAKAQVLYQLWRGREYTPIPVGYSTMVRPIRRQSRVTIYSR